MRSLPSDKIQTHSTRKASSISTVHTRHVPLRWTVPSMDILAHTTWKRTNKSTTASARRKTTVLMRSHFRSGKRTDNNIKSCDAVKGKPWNLIYRITTGGPPRPHTPAHLPVVLDGKTGGFGVLLAEQPQSETGGLLQLLQLLYESKYRHKQDDTRLFLISFMSLGSKFCQKVTKKNQKYFGRASLLSVRGAMYFE